MLHSGMSQTEWQFGKKQNKLLNAVTIGPQACSCILKDIRTIKTELRPREAMSLMAMLDIQYIACRNTSMFSYETSKKLLPAFVQRKKHCKLHLNSSLPPMWFIQFLCMPLLQIPWITFNCSTLFDFIAAQAVLVDVACWTPGSFLWASGAQS